MYNSIEALLASTGTLVGLNKEGGAVFAWMGDRVRDLGHWVDGLQPKVDHLIASLKQDLGIKAFKDLFNADVAMLEFQRLFNWLQAEIAIISRHIDDTIRATINSVMDATPGWIKHGVFGMEKTQGDQLQDKLQGLNDQRAGMLEQSTKLDQMTPAGRASFWSGWIGLNRVIEQTAAELEKFKHQGITSRQSPEELKRLDEADRAARSQIEATLQKQIEALTTAMHAHNPTFGGLPAMVQHLIDRILGGFSKGLGNAPPNFGVAPGQFGKPFSIQSAIGELAIPGSGENPQVALLKTLSGLAAQTRDSVNSIDKKTTRRQSV